MAEVCKMGRNRQVKTMAQRTDLRVSRAVSAADMLALVANLAKLSKIGVADMACSSHSVAWLSEHQILATSLAAFSLDAAWLCIVVVGDGVSFVVAIMASSAQSRSNNLIIGLVVVVPTLVGALVAARMLTAGANAKRCNVGLAAMAAPAGAESDGPILTKHSLVGVYCPRLPSLNVHAQAH